MAKKYKVYDLSHTIGPTTPLWPGSGDLVTERIQYHARDGVAGRMYHMHMHIGTHADSPFHVTHGLRYTDQLPLDGYFGTGVVVSIKKPKWAKILPEDLEKAKPKIEKGDIVIINSGMHKKYFDGPDYFFYTSGLYREAAEWFVKKGVKAVGVDQQAMDHPMATKIAKHGISQQGGKLVRPDIVEQYERETGKKVEDEFPEWEPCHKILLENGIMVWENVGGDIDLVTGKRVLIAGFPLKLQYGDGSMVRLVAIEEIG